jgi:hypothetical protein
MPMIASFGAGSARSFGFGASVPLLPVELIQNGVNGDTISDPQVGDIIIGLTGALRNHLTFLVSTPAFTSILRQQSSYQWSEADPSYWVTANLQYRILDGTETTVVEANDFNWTQYRMPKPVVSVTIQDLVSTAANGASLSLSYPAVTPTGSITSVMRFIGIGGYNNAGATISLSGTDALSTNNLRAGINMKIANDFGSGTASTTAGFYGSPSFFSTIICNSA